MSIQLRSPLPWIGGKFYSRERILKAFPSPESYKTFVDVFGGAAHILLAKPPHNHLEVYNDYCKDLVNFWMQCRNHPTELQQQIDSLPYARSLYEEWQASLFDDTPMSDMERAVRWFYVLRSSVVGEIRSGTKGHWGYAITERRRSPAPTLQSAIQLFTHIKNRLHNTQIECSDFETVIARYSHPLTFLYCDPPYVGVEHYYDGTPPFTLADHERLAQALNNTPAQVALSYYPHEALDTLYPISKWRRVTWQTYKHAEKTREARQTATEILLMNYTAPASLWQEESEGVA